MVLLAIGHEHHAIDAVDLVTAVREDLEYSAEAVGNVGAAVIHKVANVPLKLRLRAFGDLPKRAELVYGTREADDGEMDDRAQLPDHELHHSSHLLQLVLSTYVVAHIEHRHQVETAAVAICELQHHRVGVFID